MITSFIQKISGIFRNNAELPEHLQRGIWGERLAGQMLKKKGFKILGRNVRVGKRAEVDLIVKDDQCLVFVEVKTRKSEAFSRPISAVGRHKKQMLSRAAVSYLKKLKNKPPYYRFDVVEVIGSEDQPDPIIRHIENAFQTDGKYHMQW